VHTDHGGVVAPATMEGGATSPSTTLIVPAYFPHIISPDNETSGRRDGFGSASVDKWLYFLNEFVRPNLVKAFPGISFGQVSTVASRMYASLSLETKKALQTVLDTGQRPSLEEFFRSKESPAERSLRLFAALQFFFDLTRLQYQKQW
jgi:hypothetical protein